MQETGEVQDELPIMDLLPDSAALYGSIHQGIKNSFLGRFLDIYRLCQCYLVREGYLDKIEPAYLALTNNQGGYAKESFILNDGDTTLKKLGVPYVDITEESATRDIHNLMSITQLFPHEMAHVMYRLLSKEDSLSNNNRSVDMHYFSLVTDYPTAFNEGFAEHMENVARNYEENDSIRAGIREDLELIRKSTPHSISGYTRDFTMPFRIGFYKAGMINWFQKFEDYKRSEYAISGKVRYKNKSLKLRDPENRLSYRNAGVAQEESIRNIVQFHSTEGAISAFFTSLSLRNLQDMYVSDSILREICDWDPSELDPLQKQFLKYFHVIHKYVVRNQSSTSQFTDFIRGYIECFPEEEEEVRRIYKELTRIEFTPDLPPSLWLLVADHPHRLLALDPFGAIEVPLYTFNLNAAEVEDLLTIKNLQEEEAEAIIQYRDQNGYIKRLEDLRKVPGLSTEAASSIISLDFKQSEFEQILDGFNPELNIKKLIITPFLHVVKKAMLYFGIIFLIILYFLRRKQQLNRSTILKVFLRYLFLWLGIVILEMAILFLFPQYWIYSLMPMVLVILFSLLRTRIKKEKGNFAIYILTLMLLIILISVI